MVGTMVVALNAQYSVTVAVARIECADDAEAAEDECPKNAIQIGIGSSCR